jgi:hypothetical protein
MLKTVSSVANALGALNYKGTWNATTNTPTLASGVGTQGDYYVVSVAGATNLDGITNWGVGDWAAFNGSVWQRVEGGADGNFVNLDVTGTATVGGEGLFDGNVGINTNSPSSPTGKCLTVYDTSFPRINLKNSTTGDGPTDGMEFYLNGANAYILNREAGSIGFGTGNVVHMTLNTTGNLAFGSGKGIDFSATAGTGTSELLSDYEEGTWTPVLIGTTVAGTGTYTTQEGKYTKVGNLVTFQMGLNWSAHTGTGTMQIQGLPFTTSATGLGVATVYVSDVASSAGTFIECFVSNSTTDIRLREVATGGGTAAAVAMDTVGQMFISGHYYV